MFYHVGTFRVSHLKIKVIILQKQFPNLTFSKVQNDMSLIQNSQWSLKEYIISNILINVVLKHHP